MPTRPSFSKKIREVQLLEKSHLELKVALNDKIVKLALLDYELKKQKILHKKLEDCDIEI